MRWIVLMGLGLTLTAIGCGQTDAKETGDQFVREDLLAKFDKSEAIPFFEKQNGRYFDKDETTTVDRDVILPLLKQLNETAPTEQWAVLRTQMKDSACALLIGLPGDPQAVERMVKVVQQAEDQYSGCILQQWGHEWLSIDLIDQAAYEMLKKSYPDLKKRP